MTSKVPAFAFKPDVHGRYSDALAPSGGTLNIEVSGTSNGDFVPGDRAENITRPTMLRLSSTLDVRLRFSTDQEDPATSADMLFLSGSEAMPLPTGANFVNVISNDGTTGSFSLTVLE